VRRFFLPAVAGLCTLTACFHTMPFAPELERNWAQVKPSGEPIAVKVVKPGETLIFYAATASSPLVIKVGGPLKLHLQIRIRAPKGVKGRIKLTAWTQVDDQPAVFRRLNAKIAKKWRESEGGLLTRRRIVKLRLGDGEHVIRFGLAADSVETALVRVVTRSPAEER